MHLIQASMPDPSTEKHQVLQECYWSGLRSQLARTTQQFFKHWKWMKSLSLESIAASEDESQCGSTVSGLEGLMHWEANSSSSSRGSSA